MARPASRIAGARIDYDLQNQTTFNHNHNWQGESSTGAGDGVSYGTGDIVIHNNHLYISLVNNNENNTPPASGSDANWRLLTTDATGNFSIPVWAASTAYTEGTLVQHSYTPTGATDMVTRIFESLEAIPDTATAEPQNDSSNWADIAAAAAGAVTAIGGLSDVTITDPLDNQVLVYNSTTSTWLNETNPASVLNLVQLTRDRIPDPNEINLRAATFGETIEINEALNLAASQGIEHVPVPASVDPITAERSYVVRALDPERRGIDYRVYVSDAVSQLISGTGGGQLAYNVTADRFENLTESLGAAIFPSAGQSDLTDVDATNLPGLQYTTSPTSPQTRAITLSQPAGGTVTYTVNVTRSDANDPAIAEFTVAPGTSATEITVGVNDVLVITSRQARPRTIATNANNRGVGTFLIGSTTIFASTRRQLMDGWAEVIRRGFADPTNQIQDFDGNVITYTVAAHHYPTHSEVVIYDANSTQVGNGVQFRINDFVVGEGQYGGLDPSTGENGQLIGLHVDQGPVTEGQAIVEIIEQNAAGTNDIREIPLTVDFTQTQTDVQLHAGFNTAITATDANGDLLYPGYSIGPLVAGPNTGDPMEFQITGPIGQRFRLLSGFPGVSNANLNPRPDITAQATADFSVRPTLNGGPIPLDVSEFPPNAQLRVNDRSTNLEVLPPNQLFDFRSFANIVYNDVDGAVNVLRPVEAEVSLSTDTTNTFPPEVNVVFLTSDTPPRPQFFIRYDVDTRALDGDNPPDLSTFPPAIQFWEGLKNTPTASALVTTMGPLLAGDQYILLRDGGTSLPTRRFAPINTSYSGTVNTVADGTLTITNVESGSTTSVNTHTAVPGGTVIPSATQFTDSDARATQSIQFQTLVDGTVTADADGNTTVTYTRDQYIIITGQFNPASDAPNLIFRSDIISVAETAYAIGIDGLFDLISGVVQPPPPGNTSVTIGVGRRLDGFVNSVNGITPDHTGNVTLPEVTPFAESDLPTSAGDYVLNIDANNTASWTEDQDIMVQSGAVDVNTRELNLYYGATATGSPDVSIDISNLGTHDSFGLHIAGARDYDVSSVTRTIGSTSLVTVAFDSETTRNDFFRHVLGTTSTAARIGTTLNFESHTGTDPDGDDTPIATFALSPGGFFSAGNNSNEVILDPDTIAEGNAFIEAFNTATHTTLSSGDNTLRWENSATVTQLVGNDDVTPLISTDGSSFTLNLPDEGVGGTVMRTSTFPNTGAERTANNTPINVHKAYNFTTLAAGEDGTGAPTSEVITLRVNNRTIEAPADGQLSVGGSPIVTRTDLEDWSSRANYTINDEIVWQSSLYRARLDVSGEGGVRSDVHNVIDARFEDVSGVSTLIITFRENPLIPETVTPIAVTNYTVQFLLNGTPTWVRFNGTNVTRDTTADTWSVARSNTFFGNTTGVTTQAQIHDGFRSERDSTWVYESNNLATPPLNPGLNDTEWERLSNPFNIGGDSSGGSIPTWESGGLTEDGQLYYYRGPAEGDRASVYRATADIRGPANTTTPDTSANFEKIGEVVGHANNIGSESFPYGSIIIDDRLRNDNQVWMQIDTATADNFDPAADNWVNLNQTGGTSNRAELLDWDSSENYNINDEVVFNSSIYRAIGIPSTDTNIPLVAASSEAISFQTEAINTGQPETRLYMRMLLASDRDPGALDYIATFIRQGVRYQAGFNGVNVHQGGTTIPGGNETFVGGDETWHVAVTDVYFEPAAPEGGFGNLDFFPGSTSTLRTGVLPREVTITRQSHFVQEGLGNTTYNFLRIEFEMPGIAPDTTATYSYEFNYNGTPTTVTFEGSAINGTNVPDAFEKANFNWFINVDEDITGLPTGFPVNFYPTQSTVHLRATGHEADLNPGLDTDNWQRLSNPQDPSETNIISVWEERTGYVIGDVVVYEGELFRALVVIPDETGNTSVNPNPTDAADWEQLSYKPQDLIEPFRTEDLPSTDGDYVMNRTTTPASHSIIDMGEWFGQAENQSAGLREIGFRQFSTGDRITLHFDNADSMSQETELRTVSAGDRLTVTYPDPDNNNAPVTIIEAEITSVAIAGTFLEMNFPLNTYTLPTNPALYDAVRLSVSIGTFTPEAVNYIWTPQPQGVLGYRRWYMQNLRSDVGSDQTIRPVINQGPALADLTDNAQFGGALPNFQCSAVPGHTDVYAFTPSTNQTLPPGLYQVEFKLDTPNAVEVDMLELLPGSTAGTFTIPQGRFSIAAGTVGSAGQLSLSATLPMFTPAAGGRLAGAVGFIFRRVASGGPAFTDGLLTLTRLA